MAAQSFDELSNLFWKDFPATYNYFLARKKFSSVIEEETKSLEKAKIVYEPHMIVLYRQSKDVAKYCTRFNHMRGRSFCSVENNKKGSCGFVHRCFLCNSAEHSVFQKNFGVHKCDAHRDITVKPGSKEEKEELACLTCKYLKEHKRKYECETYSSIAAEYAELNQVYGVTEDALFKDWQLKPAGSKRLATVTPIAIRKAQAARIPGDTTPLPPKKSQQQAAASPRGLTPRLPIVQASPSSGTDEGESASAAIASSSWAATIEEPIKLNEIVTTTTGQEQAKPCPQLTGDFLASTRTQERERELVPALAEDFLASAKLYRNITDVPSPISVPAAIAPPVRVKMALDDLSFSFNNGVFTLGELGQDLRVDLSNGMTLSTLPDDADISKYRKSTVTIYH